MQGREVQVLQLAPRFFHWRDLIQNKPLQEEAWAHWAQLARVAGLTPEEEALRNRALRGILRRLGTEAFWIWFFNRFPLLFRLVGLFLSDKRFYHNPRALDPYDNSLVGKDVLESCKGWALGPAAMLPWMLRLFYTGLFSGDFVFLLYHFPLGLILGELTALFHASRMAQEAYCQGKGLADLERRLPLLLRAFALAPWRGDIHRSLRTTLDLLGVGG